MLVSSLDLETSILTSSSEMIFLFNLCQLEVCTAILTSSSEIEIFDILYGEMVINKNLPY